MRNTLARTLYELAQQDERIVVLVADISPAGAMEDFRRELPNRFLNVGVAEQTMIGLAAGLAQRGFKPICYTIATFALFRAYEFIRCDLAYQNLPVTVVGMGAGLSYPTLGGTHQAIEDVAVAMACPGMAVLAPCDAPETDACLQWALARESGGPVYLRLGKAGEPDLTKEAAPWEFGRLRWLLRSPFSATLVLSYGPIAAEALEVALHLGADMALVPTLQPLPDWKEFAGINGAAYERIIVIEEASGGPLWQRVAAEGIGGLEPALGFHLPQGFPHVQGTRAEVLAVLGLTAEKILENLES